MSNNNIFVLARLAVEAVLPVAMSNRSMEEYDRVYRQCLDAIACGVDGGRSSRELSDAQCHLMSFVQELPVRIAEAKPEVKTADVPPAFMRMTKEV